MKRRNLSLALTFAIAVSALILSGCATVDYRISRHPEIYQGLSPTDQALVHQGRIREGMTQDAVWLAWGSPEQKGFGRMHGRQTETWIYRAYYNEYYGPYPYGGYGLYGAVGVARHHHAVFAVYDPFYDPFFYPRFQPVSYPYKTVTFENGRVVAYQGLTPPRGGAY